MKSKLVVLGVMCTIAGITLVEWGSKVSANDKAVLGVCLIIMIPLFPIFYTIISGGKPPTPPPPGLYR